MPNDSRQQFETQLAVLVDKFERHRDYYLSNEYSESQVRLDFVDLLFGKDGLGWDVGNAAGLGPKEREVIVERGETTGRPDYNFRLAGRTVFFVEAKAPHVPLERVDVVMQAKSYAWHSRDVFIAVVSDFEEFRLYDATAKPDRKHPSAGLIFTYRYRDYLKPKTLDDLWLLSREAVATGSIDQLLKKSSVQARQRIPVDQAFLEDLSAWREQLAKAVFKSNPTLAPADLNCYVQVFLDRLIFIRICEDRRIMGARQLAEVAENWEYSGKRVSITNDLNALFHEVNDRLNGEIFKPHACEKIDWDINAPLVADIIKSLYFPASPYLFDKIPVELLGSIYERYLGKTIRVTATRAVVEDKPEVRKAGGVYYTPKYIVDYIVEQTVGKLIAGKTPKQIAGDHKGTPLRILDPACGSGSFLIGAYQKLLDYHKQYYAEHARARTALRQAQDDAQPRLIAADEGGEFKLSLEEKAAILRNNIFGVDIDPQAVEITMMSLYIKMLEDERGILSGRALLPRLRDNIKCGNSLIGYDIGLLSDADQARINPFDWNSKSEGFGEIMAAGGFDAVIGNPPYIRIQTMKEWAPTEVEFYKGKYRAASAGNYDIYVVFVEKGLSVLNKTGRLGFILPHKFFNAHYGEALRGLIAEGKHLAHVVHFGDQQVFAGASTYTCLMFLDKAGGSECRVLKVDDLNSWRESGKTVEGKIDSKDITASDWNLAVGNEAAVFEKMSKMPMKLGDVADRIFQGLVTGADPVFILRDFGRGQYFSEATQQEHKLESELMHPLCKGSVNIKRYHVTELTKSILFPYKIVDGKAVLLSVGELAAKYPNAWKYLKANRTLLESRERGKWKHERWYAFGRSQNLSEMEQCKILTPSIANHASFTLDTHLSVIFGPGLRIITEVGILSVIPVDGEDAWLNSRRLRNALMTCPCSSIGSRTCTWM